MTSPRRNDEPQVSPDRYRDAEAELGGADAVEKTTYVNGRGTEPEARSHVGEPTATVGGGRGGATIAWVVIGIMILAGIAYFAGLFT